MPIEKQELSISHKKGGATVGGDLCKREPKT
jgi:hypothetical protein